jgi:heme/copper-type cytochrome/quinol oxidase subunit 3
MATDTLDKKHTDHSHSTDNGSWEGGEYPFKVGYGKLMIWYFLLSDAFTFAGFLIAYGTLRFSMPMWPVPDFVFSTFPFLEGQHPLLFVTFMTFVLLFSSYTMIRAVQEGHRENRRGVVIWMFLTILGGLGFLGCQAWEWTTLIGKEHMSVTTNPFGSHTESGIYLDAEGKESSETFEAGSSYLLHRIDLNAAHGHDDAGHLGEHGGEYKEQAHTTEEGAVASHTPDSTRNPGVTQPVSADSSGTVNDSSQYAIGKEEAGRDQHTVTDHQAPSEHESIDDHPAEKETKGASAAGDHAADDEHGAHASHHYPGPGDYPDAVVDERGYIHRKYLVSSGENAGMVKTESFGPKAFGALFFFITGFHGFHVFSGVIFLLIILINVMSGLYVARRNKNEMVEKIGLYWHFVDLVWVFVFLVFYLL